MDVERQLLRRGVIGVGIAAIFLVVAYALFEFLAVAVFAIFLYYAVRPIFRFLSRLSLGRRVRALLSIFLFGLPFLVLIAYTVAIVAIEIEAFLDRQGVFQNGGEGWVTELNIAGFDLDALEQLVMENGSQFSADLLTDSALGAVSLVGTFFVQLLLVVIAAYYMLVDGPRFVAWLLDTYDEDNIWREYARGVDAELSLALFGNIVNVFITAIVGILTFYGYNLLVDSTIAVPFPALLGALAGIGSLIPVVGIKLVYVPLCIGLAANAWIAGEPGLLFPVTVLFVVSAVIVDFIPDFVIRAQVSSTETHTGLLIIAYIVGPSVFGFYGLFLAPIILVSATNAVKTLLPYVFTPGSTPAQTTLDSFHPETEDDRDQDSVPREERIN